MQVSFNNAAAVKSTMSSTRRLADLREGEAAVIESIDLPADFALRLMELGFIPGMSVTAARCAPGGDPRVFRVDGSEIALRRETAAQLLVKM
jgi:Fe2+ transport system protein FeoA